MAKDLTTDTKYSHVVNTIRDHIISGDYKPGDRLPTRSEIMRKFGLGTATVQKALDNLIDDGFVYTKARREGTFVSDNPPHLCEFAFVIPASSRWSKWYDALLAASQCVADGQRVRFRPYSVSSEVGMRSDVIKLCQDVTHHRLAGVIIAGMANSLVGTAALNEPGVPRVMFHPLPGSNIAAVLTDGRTFRKEAVKYLHSIGRRKIAHLVLDTELPGEWEMRKVREEICELVDDFRSYWFHPIHYVVKSHGVKNIVDVLMQLEGDKRPDALIIHDDNLVDDALEGLLAAGVKVPEELAVVAHANFPSTLNSIIPVKRIGYNCCEYLEKNLEVLDMQRRGIQPPEITYVSAICEEDLPPTCKRPEFTSVAKHFIRRNMTEDDFRIG